MFRLTLGHPQTHMSMTFIGIPGWADVDSSVMLSCWRATVWGVVGVSRGEDSMSTRIGLV